MSNFAPWPRTSACRRTRTTTSSRSATGRTPTCRWRSARRRSGPWSRSGARRHLGTARDRPRPRRRRLRACRSLSPRGRGQGRRLPRGPAAAARSAPRPPSGCPWPAPSAPSAPRAPAPTNAPAPVPPELFLGRRTDLDQLVLWLLDDDRAPIAVLGPGGIGKTALTRAALRDDRCKARFSDRRLFVPLEDVRDASGIHLTVARALGLVAGERPAEQCCPRCARRPPSWSSTMQRPPGRRTVTRSSASSASSRPSPASVWSPRSAATSFRAAPTGGP